MNSDERVPLALYHILDAIEDFVDVVGDADVAELAEDRHRRYAAERCVEIISEASRRIPREWKAKHPSIPWQEIAGIGSVIRHNYENTNPTVIIGLQDERLEQVMPAAAAIDSLRHPEVRAKRASKDGHTYGLAAILRGPRKCAGASG